MLDRPIDASDWLIYSREHNAWWKPNSQGYTTQMGGAGRYSDAESMRIVSQANYGCRADGVKEFRVRAPESLKPAPNPATRLPADAHFQLVKAFLSARIAAGDFNSRESDVREAIQLADHTEEALRNRELYLGLQEGERG